MPENITVISAICNKEIQILTKEKKDMEAASGETMNSSQGTDNMEPKLKKIKLDLETPTESEIDVKEEVQTKTSAIVEANYDLNQFKLTRILQNNTVRKSIALLGTFPDVSETDRAVVLFEKQAFRESEVQTEKPTEDISCLLKSSYFNKELKVQTEFINNIYGSFRCEPSAKLNGVKTTVVYPATENHIQKYSICQKFLINETPNLYEKLTLPYIMSSQLSLEWVYNILEHKKEKERIIYEDSDSETGFVLLPDLKWDGRSIETLYLLAIVHKRDIKSLRDLNGTHIPLLLNIRNRAAEAIEKRYGLNATQLRMYFHYQPSFYHLHVHINPVRNDAPGIWCEKSHILDTVINNLELLPNYYKCATLPFVLYDGNKLLEVYEQEMIVRRPVESAAVARNAEKENNAKEQKV